MIPTRRLLILFSILVLVGARGGVEVRAQDGAGKGAKQATEYTTETDLLYRTGDDLSEAAKQRCRLDVYRPTNVEGYATVVWFHGGGLTGGSKSIPSELKRQGIAVVAANYRLNPSVQSPTYVEDAAAAVAWTIKNIQSRGGSRERVFVAGHSAGGYLTSMVGLDRSYLAAHDLNADDIAGLIPYSGHTITHFTVRKEQGIGGKQPIIDKMAPLYHVRPDAPPILLITGDRELEMLGRYEENAYFWRMLKVAGDEDVELFELDGYDHGQMAKPAHPLMIKFIRNIVNTGS
ncbi:Lipase 2 [Rubripirellula lacrimiformis]|uniref:Lipase 2 n=1 Tax=Rubripirellula lacrimiformis TaxID=1930273 RepID=A0A517NBY2_9BACT|nr:alpha/beta hydrolase [Rubripirellula lacrimiformis]QDT04646.1 Lipase 2 [Rubripirellula lacrimiformis]